VAVCMICVQAGHVCHETTEWLHTGGSARLYAMKTTILKGKETDGKYKQLLWL
jgi:hypothetical protein